MAASRVLSTFSASSVNLQFLKHSIVPMLIQEFNYKNIDQVPKVDKIVVKYGIGEVAQSPKVVQVAIHDMAILTGQRPGKTGAAAAINPFGGKSKGKGGQDQPLGVAVTLRGKVMYSFLERLINLGIPRMIDFQGLHPNSFDGKGNYRMGFREMSVFPELADHILGKPRQLSVHISTTAETDREALRLLSLMGMPFKEGEGGGAKTVLKTKKKLKIHHHFDSKSKIKARQ